MLFCALCSLFFALSSCTDDLGFRADDVTDENFTGITLFIPDVNGAAEFGATRSDGYANTRAYDQAKEGNFNTLYIVAIDKKGPIHIFQRNQSDGVVETIYNKYQISLPAGDYKFYVVANMNRYLNTEAGESVSFYDKIHGVEDPEGAIRNLILNFNASRPLEPGFLPMACLAENIRVGSNANAANREELVEGFVNIPTGTSKYVYADLDFLCAKVRYTIIFDAENEKSEFKGTNDYIDFHRNVVTSDPPFVNYIRQQTAVKDGRANTKFLTVNSDEEADPASWPLFLDRYIHPADFDFYAATDDQELKNQFSKLKAWTAQDGAWDDKFLKKRIWQGITYLPENLESQATTLNFPYSFNGQKGTESPREIKLNDFKLKNSEDKEPGIRRAKMYDVYALVKTPDPADMVVNVSIENWTLQNLSYELHGPYELVVETTKLKELSMEKDAVFWFRSDVSPSDIGFISPKVSSAGAIDNKMVDLYIGEVVKNADGSFATNENGDYLFRIGLNPDIPYKVIDQLNNGGLDHAQVHYTKDDVAYFHLVAGSLNKYIEIENLNLDPYLIVDPQTIIIDTRELYTSGEDGATYPIPIEFRTNVDLTDATYAYLELTIPDKLTGEGEGEGSLRFIDEEIAELFTKNGNLYTYKDVENKVNEIILHLKNIIYGNPFWDKNNEYNLNFTLTLKRQNSPVLKIVKPVTIKVKPFSGSYVIHFRDNTKEWVEPHIYIFQDLTLPANMMVKNEQGVYEPYEHAGRIVGYIEENPTSGYQWNAAAQYVFTNNLAFRGWHGSHKGIYEGTQNGVKIYKSEDDIDEYGGPEKNNPWAEAHYNAAFPEDVTSLSTDTPTYGFVMFGKPDRRLADQNEDHDRKNEEFDFWNYGYAYTKTYMLAENSERTERYNYNVNFNYDHQNGIENSTSGWNCWRCRNNAPDFNAPNDQTFYPGIVMEKEDDGWWKYTLTGVAQPGRTVIIFANWHLPWDPENGWFDYRADSYRWPGDYEAGLPLFDFEDNEGWFLFDGNTLNNDQQFTDEKPVSRVIPHTFTPAYSSMRIEVKDQTVSSITVDGKTVNRSGTDAGSGISYFDASGLDIDGKETIVIRVNNKDYKLSPKFFKSGANGYTTAKPLYLEFKDGIKINVKWSDDIQPNINYWKGFENKNETCFYVPPKGGSNYLNVYWGNTESWNNPMGSYNFTGKTVGNYKNVDVDITTENPTGSVKDEIILRLCTTEGGDNRFYKYLKVEDLPQYYYPAGDYYMVNWHLLKSPYTPAGIN